MTQMSAMRLTSRQLIFLANGVMTSRRQLWPAVPGQPDVHVGFAIPVFIIAIASVKVCVCVFGRSIRLCWYIGKCGGEIKEEVKKSIGRGNVSIAPDGTRVLLWGVRMRDL